MSRPGVVLVVALAAGCNHQPASEPEKPVSDQAAAHTPVGENPALAVKPAVVPRGVEPLGEHGALVAVTASEILVEGKHVVPIAGGDVAASEKEGGAVGMSIPRLSQVLQAWAAAGGADAVGPRRPVAVLMDPAASAHLLFAVILSAKRAGARAFRLVVAGPDGTVGALPLELPDAAPESASAPQQEPDPPLQLIVTSTKETIVLWSVDGVEGSLAAPKLELAAAGGRFDAERLTAALAEIAERRWPDPSRRRADSRSIIIQADRATRFQQLAELIAAVRTRPDGSELFPDVLLGSFE